MLAPFVEGRMNQRSSCCVTSVTTPFISGACLHLLRRYQNQTNGKSLILILILYLFYFLIDRYCSECKTDTTEVIAAGEMRLTKKKANMISKKGTCTRDWGKVVHTQVPHHDIMVFTILGHGLCRAY